MAQLATADLAEGCRQKQSDNSHETYCFELFRRAILDKSEACWAAIYQEYQKLVGSWVFEFFQNDPAQIENALEDMVTDSFTAFWRAYTAEKFEQAQGLGSILAYLKSAAVTTALQVLRRKKRKERDEEWDQTVVDIHLARTAQPAEPSTQFIRQTTAKALWQVVDAICQDDRERIVARLSFVLKLMPNAIHEQYPEHFPDVQEIYQLRRNLKNRLARNDKLRAFWEEIRS